MSAALAAPVAAALAIAARHNAKIAAEVDRVKQAFSALAGEIASAVLPVVKEMTTAILRVVQWIRDMDPAVERIILRCLAADPGQRPSSAREIILALPGGDPLAAALAAGETPSPRVVAAAGADGTLTPRQAWTMLAAVAAIMTGYTAFRVSSTPTLPTPSAVLWSRSATILETLGVPARGEPIRQPRTTDGPAPYRYRSEYGVTPALSRLTPLIVSYGPTNLRTSFFLPEGRTLPRATTILTKRRVSTSCPRTV
jgi:hypothetical protein